MIIEKINKEEITEKELSNIVDSLTSIINKLKISEDIPFPKYKELIDKFNEIRDHYLTLYWISYIGYLKDIKNPKYLNTEKLISKYESIIDNLVNEYFKCLINYKYKEELINYIGNRNYEMAGNQSIIVSNDISKLRIREKELCMQYRKTLMSLKFTFDNKEMNLSGLSSYYNVSDEKLRKASYDKRYKILESLEQELDVIFDNLVKVRTEIANKLKFNSYADLCFVKMNRIGYTYNDLDLLKENVRKYIVPILNILKEYQKERLNVSNISYYNKNYLFNDGNAVVKISLEELISNISKILHKYNNRVGLMFDTMLKEGLIDLENRENKSSGGVTTYLPDYRMPIFIKKYMNLEANVTSIFHEIGHSIQLYLSRNLLFHENRWPTFDICEIHSTSLEFLMYPFLNMFFKEDENKYKIRHLSSSLSLIVSMCISDDFQKYIYDNPNISSEDRKEYWLYLINKYGIKDNTHSYFGKGIEWQADINRIDDPFYGIDYAISNICALSFYDRVNNDVECAFSDYFDLCSKGNTLSLKRIIKKYRLNNPFEGNDIKKLSDNIIKEIDKL